MNKGAKGEFVEKSSLAMFVDATYLSYPIDEDCHSFVECCRRNPFATICTYPSYGEVFGIKNKAMNLSYVIGFPSGVQDLNVKATELLNAKIDGAAEVDYVLDPNYLDAKGEIYFASEIKLTMNLGFEMVKFIFETRILSDDKLSFAMASMGKIVRENSLDGKFLVKNSTGMPVRKEIDRFGEVSNFDKSWKYIKMLDELGKVGGWRYGFKLAGGVDSEAQLSKILEQDEVDIRRVGVSRVVDIFGGN